MTLVVCLLRWFIIKTAKGELKAGAVEKERESDSLNKSGSKVKSSTFMRKNQKTWWLECGNFVSFYALSASYLNQFKCPQIICFVFTRVDWKVGFAPAAADEIKINQSNFDYKCKSVKLLLFFLLFVSPFFALSLLGHLMSSVEKRKLALTHINYW